MPTEREPDWLEVGTCFFSIDFEKIPFPFYLRARKRWKPTPLTFPLLKCLPPSSKPMLTAAASGMKEKKERQTHLQTPLLFHLCRLLPFLPPPTSISPTWERQWTYNQARESTTFDFWDDSDNVNIFSENCSWVSKLILKYISNW